MKTLDQIAIHYGTDKSSLSHNYTARYASYFEDIRMEKLKILEIGVKRGESVRMWKEYFQISEIIGIDIENCKKHEEDRIHIEQGDQTDTQFLTSINSQYGPFDIIIDDGSHVNSHIKTSFDCLFPLLKNGGLYIVEDLHACYWDDCHGGKNPVFIDNLKKMVDYINASGKSHTGDIRNGPANIEKLNWWEKNIEFMHLYRSIVFIGKCSEESSLGRFSRKITKAKNKYLNLRKIIRKLGLIIQKE